MRRRRDTRLSSYVDLTVRRRLRQNAWSLVQRAFALDRFIDWLQAARVSPEPGNAAPGTSAHGQMRAVDFVVMQGGRVVAGTTQATIPTAWTASGWARSLADATAGTQLVGPLAHPYEPWHWSLP